MRSKLFAEIEKPRLERLLRSLYYCIGLPISVLDEKGVIVCGFGEITLFCSTFKSFIHEDTPAADSCAGLHRRAGLRCMKMGETFIFTCHASLDHIIFPLRGDAALYGSILVGPFLIEALSDETLEDISTQYSLKPAQILKLIHTTGSIPVISSEKAGQISALLDAVFDPLMQGKAENAKENDDAEAGSVSDKAVREFISKTHKNSNKIVQEAVSYIAENYNRQITLEDIARHVGMTPSYISTLFKQSYDVSYREFFNMVRVEAAKALLKSTNDSILDISGVTGFEDQSYFTKVFKRYTGMTPKQYRACF